MLEVDMPAPAVPVGAVEERAALRRVARLAAGGAPCDELSAAVNEEVARLAGTDATSARREPFTELAANAIDNARARAELERMVEEQRALRRVATLVARGAPPAEVFETVAAAASGLLDGAAVAVLRGRPERDDEPGTAPIVVGGRHWGRIVATTDQQSVPAGTEELLADFAELAAAAIENAESRAALAASRARIVATADQARRRIQRDVHDGAQQRLAHAIITLKLARSALGDAAGPVAELVDESLENAERATATLHETMRGIMPRALGSGGLGSAIELLARDLGLPVRIDVPGDRLPADLEATAYFIVVEALTNVVQHSGASSAQVTAAVEARALHVAVRDDGAGGADPARGSGIVGLTDRVAARGGTIVITSPPAEGTTVAVTLPLAG